MARAIHPAIHHALGRAVAGCNVLGQRPPAGIVGLDPREPLADLDELSPVAIVGVVVEIVVLPQIGAVIAGGLVQKGNSLQRGEVVLGADGVHPVHHLLLVGGVDDGSQLPAATAVIGLRRDALQGDRRDEQWTGRGILDGAWRCDTGRCL